MFGSLSVRAASELSFFLSLSFIPSLVFHPFFLSIYLSFFHLLSFHLSIYGPLYCTVCTVILPSFLCFSVFPFIFLSPFLSFYLSILVFPFILLSFLLSFLSLHLSFHYFYLSSVSLSFPYHVVFAVILLVFLYLLSFFLSFFQSIILSLSSLTALFITQMK